jgi:hypothetical protein
VNEFPAAVLLALALAACGAPEPPVRLRHEEKRTLVYELEQSEDAPHPLIGLGGKLDVGATLALSCLQVGPDGVGEYEVTVRHVKVTGPPSAGAAVDTKLGRPVEGDRIHANNVAQALLPRRAIVAIRPDAQVGGASPDLEIGRHLAEFMKNKPVASRKVVYRMAEALDAGPLTLRWFQPVTPLFPPNEHAPHGSAWTTTYPAIETPAGRLVATADVVYRREGVFAVLEATGKFAPEGELPAQRQLDLEGSELHATARIDLARGVLASYEESGSFDFRLHDEGKSAVRWAHTRRLRLVESSDAAAPK